jgi:hypothetical protein
MAAAHHELQEFYGLAPQKAHRSQLGEIPERLYRSPDLERARREILAA